MKNFSLWLGSAFVATTALAAPVGGLVKIDDPVVIERAVKAIEDNKLTNVDVIRDQSFKMTSRGAMVANIVAARAVTTGSTARDFICVAVLVDLMGKTQLVRTIGAGNWEAESCTGVEAIGAIGEIQDFGGKLAVLYNARSPNSAVIEPIVLVVRDGVLGIELNDSSKLSLAGVKKLSKIKDVIRK